MEIQKEITDDIVNTEFTQGFNDASILADYAPELLNDISPVHNLQNDYFGGFFSGKAHCLAEKDQEKQIDELQSIRSASKSKDNERER